MASLAFRANGRGLEETATQRTHFRPRNLTTVLSFPRSVQCTAIRSDLVLKMRRRDPRNHLFCKTTTAYTQPQKHPRFFCSGNRNILVFFVYSTYALWDLLTAVPHPAGRGPVTAEGTPTCPSPSRSTSSALSVKKRGKKMLEKLLEVTVFFILMHIHVSALSKATRPLQ